MYMSNIKTQATLGDIYGKMLNKVREKVVTEKSHPSEDIGEAPLVKGGPQTTAGYMEPSLDKKKLSDKELEDNFYNIDELSEDENSDCDEDEENERSPNVMEGEADTVWVGDDGESVDGVVTYKALKNPLTGQISIELTGGYVTGNNPSARMNDDMINHMIKDDFYSQEHKDAALADAEEKFGKNNPEMQEIARESLNNFMKKKSYFDQIYENVFDGGMVTDENQEELDALGIDDSGDDLGEGEGDDQVTVTFDRATAQMICDTLQGALGTGEEEVADEGEMEDFGSEEGYEEDEEGLAPSQLKSVDFGKNNKVSNVKPVGRSASTKFTNKVGNDGEHGHSLHNARQPNMGTNNKVSNLKVNQGAFQQ